MDDHERRRQQAGSWIDPASLRLAECEAELRRLVGKDRGRRRQKLAARADRYRDLIAHLRGLLDQVREAPAARIEKLDGERLSLRARLLELAGDLGSAVDRWKELRARWGALANEAMREREERGEPSGRIPDLDFQIPPPSPGDPEDVRAAHDLLRRLGL